MDAKLKEIIELLFAGMFGAIISVPFFDIKNYAKRVFLVFCGTATAYYLTEPLLIYAGLGVEHKPATGFILGLFGMRIIVKLQNFLENLDLDGMLAFFEKKTPLKRKVKKNDDKPEF